MMSGDENLLKIIDLEASIAKERKDKQECVWSMLKTGRDQDKEGCSSEMNSTLGLHNKLWS